MKKIGFYSLLIFLTALTRLLPHPANFSPVAAIALVGGVYFERKTGLVIPLLALLISDIFLGFHATMPFVYGSFIITWLIGIWLKSHKRPLLIIGGVALSSVIFFLITNFGVWLTGGGWYYPKTLSGLIECYIMAIPFFRNSFLGDFIYAGALFGIIELVEYIIKVRQSKTIKV